MKVTFNIDFHTRMGQQVFIVGSIPELGNWNEEKALGLDFSDGKCLQSLELKEYKEITYRYFVKDFHSGELVYEQGIKRTLVLPNAKALFVKDFWKSPSETDIVYNSSLFSKVLHKRKKTTKSKQTGNFILQICAPSVQPDEQVFVIGNHEKLGNWDEQEALPLSDANFPIFSCQIATKKADFPLEYKYIVKKKGEKTVWENGSNRVIAMQPSNATKFMITDEKLRISSKNWRGAGVSIPVFSLRTANSYGVGEFLDLKEMVDWASAVNLNVIQILPINDTTITNTWADSYPYKPISVFALHPMYLNIPKLKRMTATEKKKYEKEQKELNALETVDYELVNQRKIAYAKAFFDKQKKAFLESTAFKIFFENNKEWLQAYAGFCYLRDLNGTADFTRWKNNAEFSTKNLAKLTNKKAKHFDDIAFHYYVQFHLDKQLKEAVDYAREKNVALKGDIPIGIGRESVDAWQKPQLYNLKSNAGAPPDAFAMQGQNWGFPTYNWEEMAKDGFAWWKHRFQKMTDYFDAYRIDHILGFFRIWEIPENAVWGLLGHFNKALPFSTEELAQRGLSFDYDRFCKPYIREHILYEIFGEHTQFVKESFLNARGFEFYELRDEFNTQKKLTEYFENKEQSFQDKQIKDGLMSLPAEVLFIPDPVNPALFHPRISFHSTLSYRDLDNYTKEVLNDIYTHFFYHRHDGFWWQQAMCKLPEIVASTDMLVCGEDLGMVPECVPDVMWRLKILSLEIQRMPKDSKVKFGHPNHAPYLSVCTTSTHDMSTVRAWWEENREESQKFYNTTLGKQGEAPYFAEPWLCEAILVQHLYSPAMLTIFPLQDLLAIDGKLRAEDPNAERINVPSNPKHYWRYRMHLSLEQLKQEKNFNAKLKELVENSGR